MITNLPEFLQTPQARIALAVLALLALWLVKRFAMRLLIRSLERLARRTRSGLSTTIKEALDTPLNLLTIAIALLLVKEIAGLDTSVSAFMAQLTRTLIMLAIFSGAYKVIGLLMNSANTLSNISGLYVDEQLLPFFRTGIRLTLIAVVTVVIIQEWGYDVGSLIAGLGLGGLAFALAAQETVSNLFGFTTIVGDRPFMVGDFIKTPDVEGIVEHVGLRSTRVRRGGYEEISIPNSTLAASTISRRRRRHIRFTLGVTYSTSADQMEALLTGLRALLLATEDVVGDTVIVHFTEFGSSSLDILIHCDVLISEWGDFLRKREAVNLSIMRLLAEMGLSVAFPSRSLYVETLPQSTNNSQL